MSRTAIPVARVGNDFAFPRPMMKAPGANTAMKVEASVPAITVSPQEVLPAQVPEASGSISGGTEDFGGTRFSRPKLSLPSRPSRDDLPNVFHTHTFIIVAAASLILGTAAIKLGGAYWSTEHIRLASATATIKTGTKPVSGFNTTVSASDFQAKLQQITAQPVTLTVGTFSDHIAGSSVKNWLEITTNKQKTEYYIHVNEAAMSNSLLKEAKDYARAPVNQVTVNEDGVSVVALAGKDGRALSDPNGLKAQAHDAAKNVLAGKGLQFNTPLVTQPFQAVTPAAFGKLLVGSTTKKKLWAFQNGQQVGSWLTSDGAADTPTPLGEYHVYAKFAVQDMWGYGPGHKYYFQPHVRWISYFYQGSAVHGVYWHPLSWFGAINSSHGCIGLPEPDAEWIYNWDNIGTTVIVHA